MMPNNLFMRLFYLIVFGLFMHVVVSAQQFRSGYIVTKENDTIRGYLLEERTVSVFRHCKFRKHGQEDVVKYTPHEIAGYGIDQDKRYEAKKIDLNGELEEYFLEYLVNGVVNLYFIVSNYTEYYYIEKDQEMIQLSNEEIETANGYIKQTNQYIGALTYIMSDSPELLPEVKNSGFSAKSLINITTEYHNATCTEYSCINYTSNTRTWFYLEPYIGFNHAVLFIASTEGEAIDQSAIAGIDFRFSSSQQLKRLSGLVGVSLTKSQFDATFYSTLFTGFPRRYDVEVSYLGLRIPLGVQYEIIDRKVSFYSGIGYTNLFMLNSSSKVEEYVVGYEEPFSVDNYIQNYQLGGYLELGLRYRTSENNYLLAKSRFEMSEVLFDDGKSLMNYQKGRSIQFIIAYGFKLGKQ